MKGLGEKLTPTSLQEMTGKLSWPMNLLFGLNSVF